MHIKLTSPGRLRDMEQGSSELLPSPMAVTEALDGLLQDITCLVQSHAISAKEISRALKLVMSLIKRINRHFDNAYHLYRLDIILMQLVSDHAAAHLRSCSC